MHTHVRNVRTRTKKDSLEEGVVRGKYVHVYLYYGSMVRVRVRVCCVAVCAVCGVLCRAQ